MTKIKARPGMTAASSEGRTITGLALPYGVPGNSSRGVVTVPRGAVTFAQDLKRIKLYRDHSDAAGSPVGYCTSAEETDDGIMMSFKIGATPDGDAALADVTEGIRDALSVEIMGVEMGPGQTLTAGTITAVAIVAVPAFDDARVSAFTASLHVDTDDDDDGDVDDDKDTDDDDDGDVDNTDDNDDDSTDDKDTDDMPQPKQTKTAGAPTGLTATRKRTPDAITFARVMETLTAVREHRTPDDSMTAALADITRAAHPAVASTAWLGELWQGVSYQREIVPTMTKKTLTSMRATGWRWVTKPTVDDYAGNKTDIPTNTPTTEAVTLTPRRLAGGHDIDRAYIDFNDSEFLASYFAAMTESYAMVSDDRAATFLATQAANNVAPGQSDLLRAAAKARQLIKQATRTEATTYLVHPDDMFSLLDVTTLDNPAYLELIGVDPARFVTSDAVEQGTLTAYAKPAVEFYELGSAPIRVEAEHIAQGGRDAAVFGYYVPFLANPRGIIQVPFGA